MRLCSGCEKGLVIALHHSQAVVIAPTIEKREPTYRLCVPSGARKTSISNP